MNDVMTTKGRRGAVDPVRGALRKALEASGVPGAGVLARDAAAFAPAAGDTGVLRLPRAVRPRRTQPVSTTGAACALDCPHCGGKFLASMEDPDAAAANAAGADPPKSWLISGGCDAGGRVVPPAPGLLRALAATGRINWHPGLVSRADVEAMRGWVDRISFDFVGCDATIREVLGLDATVADYRAVYRLLGEIAPVVCHLVVGLHAGEVRGEYRALEVLAEEGVDALVLLVLWPAPGTGFAALSPPDLSEVHRVFCAARAQLPRADIGLGCMRPPGRYRVALDLVAAALGLDWIVQPTRPAADFLGDADAVFDECCAFLTDSTGTGGRC